MYDHQVFTMQRFGGISRYFVEIARRLSGADDTDVRIVAPLYVNRYLHELAPELVVGRQLSRGRRKLMNFYNAIAIRYPLADFDPDIFHETYYSKYSVPLRDNQARVVTVYDMIHERFPQDFPSTDKSAKFKRLAIERADHVICISENTRRDLLDMVNVDSAKVSVVHLGVDVDDSDGSPEENLIDKPYLLYVGLRGGYKNFGRLLQAYASSSPLRENFCLVCFGGQDFSRSETEEIQKLNLRQGQVVWMGGSDRVLMSLYAHAAAFVYPSLYEGFGIPPLEAMAGSCPVVCSSGSSISEVVGDAGEFFDPYDSSAIACAIEKVTSSPSRSAELVDLGWQRLKSFTWAECARGTRDVYASLV